jgi:hypothetical protein
VVTPRSVCLLAAALLALTGCAALRDRLAYEDMPPRLEKWGFSVERPPNANWFLRPSEEGPKTVVLRRELAPSTTHSLYALVSLGTLDRQPASHEEFAELARSRGQQADYQVVRKSYQQSLTTRQDQWCIRVESVDTTYGAPVAPQGELTLIVRGYRCLHPALRQTTLDFFYSERGLPDEIDPRLYPEAERILDGVRIEELPPEPPGGYPPALMPW